MTFLERQTDTWSSSSTRRSRATCSSSRTTCQRSRAAEGENFWAKELWEDGDR
jgi:hypothetical protein